MLRRSVTAEFASKKAVIFLEGQRVHFSLAPYECVNMSVAHLERSSNRAYFYRYRYRSFTVVVVVVVVVKPLFCRCLQRQDDAGTGEVV